MGTFSFLFISDTALRNSQAQTALINAPLRKSMLETASVPQGRPCQGLMSYINILYSKRIMTKSSHDDRRTVERLKRILRKYISHCAAHGLGVVADASFAVGRVMFPLLSIHLLRPLRAHRRLATIWPMKSQGAH